MDASKQIINIHLVITPTIRDSNKFMYCYDGATYLLRTCMYLQRVRSLKRRLKVYVLLSSAIVRRREEDIDSMEELRQIGTKISTDGPSKIRYCSKMWLKSFNIY